MILWEGMKVQALGNTGDTGGVRRWGAGDTGGVRRLECGGGR